MKRVLVTLKNTRSAHGEAKKRTRVLCSEHHLCPSPSSSGASRSSCASLQSGSFCDMFDSFFNKGFRASKCKTLLKLATSRIKLLRNKRDVQLKQMRRELAQLLQNDQESAARIRVEHIIREQNILAAYDILELYCELIAVRLPIIESQRECPIDLLEAISSLIFAAPRCADLPELLEVRGLFATKYGKEFIAAATELRPGCGVSRQIIEKLSVRAPTAELKLKLMKEIAEQNDVDWDPSAVETELFRSPEDLLDGPNQFLSATQQSIQAGVGDRSHLSTFKFFEKPPETKASLDDVDAGTNESQSMKNVPSLKEEAESSLPFVSQHETSEKQFIPFVMPSTKDETGTNVPQQTKAGFDSNSVLKRSHSRAKSEGSTKYQDVVEAALAAAESAEKAAHAARAAANLAKLKMFADPSATFKSARVITSDSDDDSSAASRSEFSISDNMQGLRKSGIQTTMEGTEIEHKKTETVESGEHDMTFGLSDAVNPFAVGSILQAPGHLNHPMTTRGREHDPLYDMPTFDEPTQKFTSPQPHRLPSFGDDLDLHYPNLFRERSMSNYPAKSEDLYQGESDAVSFSPSAPPIEPVGNNFDDLDARFRSLKFIS